MADDDVVIKVAADVAAGAAALDTLVQQMGDVLKILQETQAQTKENEDQNKSWFETMASGFGSSKSAAFAWGQVLKESFDTVKGLVTSSIAAFPNMIAGAAAAGDELAGMANRLGTTAAAIDEMKLIATEASVPFEGMARAAQNLGSELQDSSSKASQAFAQMGLDASKLKDAPEDALFEFVKAVKSTGTAAEQNAKLVEVLGSKARMLTPLLRENIDDLRADAKALSLTAEETNKLAEQGNAYSQNLTRIKKAQETFTNHLALAFLPTVNTILKELPALGGAVLLVGEQLGSAGKKIGELAINAAFAGGPKGVQSLVKNFKDFGPVLQKTAVAMKALTLEMLANPWTLLAVAIVAIGAALFKLMGGMEGVNKLVVDMIQIFKDLWTVSKVVWAAIVDGALKLWEYLKDIPIIGLYFKALGAELELFKKALMAVWEMAKKAIEMVAGWFQKAKNWLHLWADEVRATDAEQDKSNEKQEEKARVVKSAMDIALESAARVQGAYKELTAAQQADIDKLKAAGQNAKEIAGNMTLAFDGVKLSTDEATRAVALYLKAQEDAKKASDKSPFAKLMEDAKALDKALTDASKAGMDAATMVTRFGEDAAKAVASAKGLPGAMEKLTPQVKEAAAAWNAAQLRPKMKELTDAANELAKSFSEKMVAGSRAAAQSVKSMLMEMKVAMMSTSDARVMRLAMEKDANAATNQAARDEADKTLQAEIAAIEALTDKNVAEEERQAAAEVRPVDTAKMNSFLAMEAVERKAAEDRAARTRAAADLQLSVANNLATQNAAIEAGTTANFEVNMKARGQVTLAAAQEELRIETDTLAQMTKNRKDVSDEVYEAQVQKVKDANDAAAQNYEAYAKAHGIKTQAMYNNDAKIQRDILAKMDKNREAGDEAAYAAQVERTRESEELASNSLTRELKDHGVKTKAALDAEVVKQRAFLTTLKKEGSGATQAAIEAQAAVVTAAEEAAKGTSNAWKSAGDSMISNFQTLAQIAGDSMSEIARSIGTASQAGKMMGEGWKGMKTQFKGVKDDAGNITHDWKAFSQSAVQTATAVIQGTQAMFKATETLSTKKSITGAAMAGASMGMQIAGPWGAAVGAGVGAIVGVFKNRDARKAAKEVAKDLGTEITFETAKAIQDEGNKAFGGGVAGRNIAKTMHLGDIIKDAKGVTGKNFEGFTAEFQKGIEHLADGTFTVEQFGKMADEVFPQLAQHAVTTGGVWTKEFSGIVKELKATGKEVVGLKELIDSQLVTAATGLSKVVSGFASGPKMDKANELRAQQKEMEARQKEINAARQSPNVDRDESDQLAEEFDNLQKKLTPVREELAKIRGEVVGGQDEFDRLSRISLATFNAMIGQGKTTVEAIMAIAPSIEQLRVGMDTLGLNSNEAFDKMGRLSDLTIKNQALIESVGGLNEMMSALGNLGALDQQTFNDLQTQGESAFSKLKEAGFSENEALAQMAPMLETVRTLHKEKNLAVDEGTAALIAQAEKQGVLKEEQISTNDIMLQGLGAIIEAVGGKLPEAWKTAATKAKASTEEIGGNIDKNVTKPTKDANKAVEDTNWKGWAGKAATAAQIASDKLHGTEGAAKDVDKQLADTDWERWQKEAVDAAEAASKAIDGVSLGHSPGGIKEIPIKIAEAIKAFREFEKHGVGSAEEVKDAIDAMQVDKVREIKIKATTAAMDSEVMVRNEHIDHLDETLQAMQVAAQANSQVHINIDRPILKDRQAIQELALEVTKNLKSAIHPSGAWK